MQGIKLVAVASLIAPLRPYCDHPESRTTEDPPKPQRERTLGAKVQPLLRPPEHKGPACPVRPRFPQPRAYIPVARSSQVQQSEDRQETAAHSPGRQCLHKARTHWTRPAGTAADRRGRGLVATGAPRLLTGPAPRRPGWRCARTSSCRSSSCR